MSCSVCLFVCLTIYLSVYLSDHPSVCHLPACLSICLPPAAAFHPYCPQGFGNNFRRKYTQSRVICQSVVVKVASHVCKFGLFAPSFFSLNSTGANRGFLPPSVFMDVVPNSCKSPLSSGCFASGIPQGRHLQMPGRSWRAGKAVWRWKARRP